MKVDEFVETYDDAPGFETEVIKHNINNQIETENDIIEENIKLEALLKEIESSKTHVSKLEEQVKQARKELSQIVETKSNEEELINKVISNFQIKSKTLTVLSKEGNLAKLKKLVENGNDRLLELSNQWKEVQAPLLKQYNALQSNINSHEVKLQNEQDKIKNIKEKCQQIRDELKEKETMEIQLERECERYRKNTNRCAYTRRILEIISNIKKQNDEIQKILKDTKEIQKDINNLNGQLDRSFTLSDELIFRNAKQDEMSRKAYKLLAALHNECGVIIQAVTELGLTERESRNLQEQIDAESDKATAVNLERVNADLKNVKKETDLLLKQIQV